MAVKMKNNLSTFDSRLQLIKSHTDINEIKDPILKELKNLIINSGLNKNYGRILFLYDPHGKISRFTLDQIYKSISLSTVKNNTLLFLVSNGGSAEAAYLTSKICKEYSNKFVVVIPRMAKSAATLLALGADEIHMDSISELGPIDPQLDSLPALGIDSAIRFLAEVNSSYPDSSEMFAKYLKYTLGIKYLGFSQRVAESSKQYAFRLLGDKKLGDGNTAESVSEKLVYGYKDHGFVISKEESRDLLGEMIKSGTLEFKLGNEVYKFLDEIQFLVGLIRKKRFSIIGSSEESLFFENI